MALEDQKKRTLDALERRFAVAKAELLQQQQKNKRRFQEEDETVVHNTNYSSSIASSAHISDASITPSSNTSFKKANLAFSDRATAQDVEANSPTYAHLSHPIHENLLTTNVKISSRKGSMVDKILHELLQNGDSAQKYMQGSRGMKIDNWILLDNFVQGRGASVGARIKALQSHSKRSKKHMSMKQLKKCGLLELPQELHKKNQLAQCLLGADLHGAIILVAECKIAAFTGVIGIMIRETAETFGIITQDDKFRVVPKKASVFIFQADCWKITLHGDKLTSRSLGS